MFKKKNIVEVAKPIEPVKPLEFVSTCYTKRPFIVVAHMMRNVESLPPSIIKILIREGRLQQAQMGSFFVGELSITNEDKFVVSNAYVVKNDRFLELYDPIETPPYLVDRVIPEGYFYYRAKPVIKTAFQITKEWVAWVMEQDNKMEMLEKIDKNVFDDITCRTGQVSQALEHFSSFTSCYIYQITKNAFNRFLGGYLVRESDGKEYFVRKEGFEMLYEKTSLDNKESILFDAIAIQEKARYYAQKAYLEDICEGDYILTLTTKRESIIVKTEVFEKDYEDDDCTYNGYKHKREFAKIVKITPSNIKELASLIGENALKDDHIQIGTEYATYGNHIALYEKNYYILEGAYFTKTFDIL